MAMFTYGVACALDEVSREAPIVLRGGIDQICETAAQIGYQAIELQMRDPQRFDWRDIRRVGDQAGLKFAAIATGREFVENGLCLISDDPAGRRAAIDRLKLHIDMAAFIGAMVIVGSMRSKISDFSRFDHYLGLLTEAKLELAEYAEGKNVVILVENILASTSNYLNTMRQVTDYVHRLNRPNILVHLDTYSMLMEDNDIAAAVEYCASKLAYVHFADSARLFPGGGNVDFKTFMKALRKAGYRGYVTTECVPLPDEYACAKNGLDYLRALEECIRIESALVR
ncbi:MAG: sugar phosphate isomerase/epimerase [Planctomycetota bacterium]|jgi:sugar phosphate isomerase/epimerase|nr:sugar phosphate isomerase/epimerase [Planctomycetota bacterium]